MKKASVSRASKMSIRVVGNGYSVKVGDDDSGGCGVYSSTISVSFNGSIQRVSTPLAGTYVFNDFSQLSAFLRKHLTAPSGL